MSHIFNETFDTENKNDNIRLIECLCRPLFFK